MQWLPHVITWTRVAQGPLQGQLFRDIVVARDLIRLPVSFSDLFDAGCRFTCPNSNTVSPRPTICLLCGE